MNDNRCYLWSDGLVHRPEYPHIEKWITNGARVIDLGCGNGSLLWILREKKNIMEMGIDVSPSGVKICKKRGLNVREGKIDVELTDIPAHSFDFAICNATLQMVMYPEVTLREMKRIARYQIVSFPNFGFLLNRVELLFLGRMPRRMLGGYKWYDTGHIHQLSIEDFKVMVAFMDLRIRSSVFLGRLIGLNSIWPNLFAQNAIFLLTTE